MTNRQKDLVQQTFALVAPIADAAAAIFYARLFELDPSLRPMFKIDIEEQGRKLMQVLAVAVRGLDDLPTLVPVVQALGARHAGYGVKDEHYGTVASALLYTLDKGLGDKFTSEVKDAWVEVYTILANTMKDAAKAVPVAAS
jgi:hemoglobin-like flavoprotein